VAERLKAPVLKTGRRASVSRVRIPPHPPINFLAICPQRLHPLGAFVWFQLAIGTHLAPKHFGLCSRPYDFLSVGLRIVSIDVAAASSVLSNK
jgi:hypothetical protein